MPIPSCQRLQPTPRLLLEPPMSLGWAIALLLVMAFPAIACGPPASFLYGAKLLVVPAIAILSSYGLAFVAIVGLEALILHKREDITYPKAIRCTLIAQSFYLVTCFFMFSNWGAYPLPVLGGALSGIMCTRFIQRSGFWKNIPKLVFNALVILGFIGLDLTNFFLVNSLKASQPLPYLYLCTSGILLIGFIASVVSKTFVLYDLLKPKTATLLSTVLSMNVGSFALVGSTLLIKAVLGHPL